MLSRDAHVAKFQAVDIILAMPCHAFSLHFELRAQACHCLPLIMPNMPKAHDITMDHLYFSLLFIISAMPPCAYFSYFRRSAIHYQQRAATSARRLYDDLEYYAIVGLLRRTLRYAPR